MSSIPTLCGSMAGRSYAAGTRKRPGVTNYITSLGGEMVRSLYPTSRYALACLTVLLLVLFPTLTVADQEEQESIKLGAIVSLTGDAARNGLNWLEGAQLAVDQLNKDGQPTKLIVEDDGTVPSRVATAFAKLAAVDKVEGIIGGTWDFLAETAYPLAKQYQVPFVTPTNPIEILSPAALTNPWIFTNGLTLAAEKKVITDFLKKEKVKTLGLVYINVPYGTSHADLLREIAKDLGISIVVDSELSYEGFHQSLKLAALRLAKKIPDLVFVVSNYEGVDLLLREFELVGISPPTLITHTLKEALEFGKSDERYKRVFGVFPKFSSERFESDFQEKFGHEAYDYAAVGYDAVMFMAKLVQAKKNTELEKIKLTYDGVMGRHQLPSKDRCVVHSEAMIVGTDNGKLVRILP